MMIFRALCEAIITDAHCSSSTAAAVYSCQSESIREDLPVLQRLRQAAILQNPLMKN